MENLTTNWRVWAWPLIVLGGATLIALIGHRILFSILRRITLRKGGLLINSLIRHAFFRTTRCHQFSAPPAWG